MYLVVCVHASFIAVMSPDVQTQLDASNGGNDNMLVAFVGNQSDDEYDSDMETGYISDRFAPKPGEGTSKITTFSKAQRKRVARGAKKVDDQDKAMWATITGQRINPMKKVLLAVTLLTSGIQGAIGQVTSFVDV